MVPSLLKEKLLGTIVTFIYQLISSTYRYQIHFEDESDRKEFYDDVYCLKPHPGNHIIAFFHQSELCFIPFFAEKNIVILVSQSKDGEIMATALEKFGYKIVRGSSSRRAIGGFIECMKLVRQGYKASMAVDGPKGPIYQVKEGIPTLSEKTQKKIVPLAAYPQWHHCFEKSWNKALFPKPFSRINIVVGKIDFYSREQLQEKMLNLNSQVKEL
ncbi:MAG: lysophospholipid acyltransferase family protein [Halobacteriovoraceae bacterium]|nr:lysophospholipid acyltransferase family protein [Halobacteriovoraceae bacterium]